MVKGRPDCPRCQGQGLVFDPDPQKPVLVCGCTADVAPDAETLGLPARYRAPRRGSGSAARSRS